MPTSNTSGSNETTAWTIFKMSLIGWPLLVTLSACSKWNESQSALSGNNSALYDPPVITLKEGVTYDFHEGSLVGRANHKFFSEYSFRRAVIIGSDK